jgi:hypothetical protein
MGLPDTSPVPKKDSMGMDYIPVYEGDDQDDNNTVKVSLDRIQRSGVRIEKVQLRTVVRAIRAPSVAIRPAVLNRDVSPLGETTLAQTGLECGGEMHEAGGGLTVEKADHRQRALLRARQQRPRCRAAAE